MHRSSLLSHFASIPQMNGQGGDLDSNNFVLHQGYQRKTKNGKLVRYFTAWVKKLRIDINKHFYREQKEI